MISFLSGKIILKEEKFLVLDVNGVGFKIFISKKTLNNIPEIGALLNVFTYLAVRENSMDLFGFLNKKELDLFEFLLDIPGIGPKVASEIASLGPLEKLKKEIDLNGEKAFAGISGVGTKRAKAIILELSGKIKEIEKESPKHYDEAEDALVGLGFSRQDIKEALSKIPKEITDSEQKIKEALKLLGR